MSGRLTIIGLDGATHKILVPLAEEGIIPNIKSLMDNGCWGSLISTFPPLTSPAWGTLMTGKLPGKIGIYGFKDSSCSSYTPGMINSTSIKSKMLWEAAGEAGKKVCVLNFPLTYPVRAANGVVVSGLLTPHNATDFFYPQNLSEEVEGYPIQGIYSQQVDDFESYYENLFAEMNKRASYLKRIIKREDPDLLMYCIQETDLTHHMMAKYFYPQFEEYKSPAGERVRNLNMKMYSTIDGIIGDLISISGDDSTFMIVSDHGSAPSSKYSFNLNKLLEQEGFIKSNLGGFHRILYSNTKGTVQDWVGKKFPHKTSPIDFTKTYAWCESYRCNCPGIVVNLKGRFPHGIVNPGAEYDELIEKIISVLDGLKHNGSKVVDRVYRREEIYRGPYTDASPDLVFTMHQDYDVPITKFRNNLKKKEIFEKDEFKINNHTGSHIFDGSYVFKGPNMNKKGKFGDVGIESIAPTAIYLLGLPVPSDMDGRVIEEAIDEKHLGENPVSYSEAISYMGESSRLSQAEEAILTGQLNDLGYL